MKIFNIFRKQNNIDALKIMKDTYSTIGSKRHEYSLEIINNYGKSKNPLDILAVAIAYEREGAKFRKNSIAYYEKYLSFKITNPFFDDWLIYSSLANLYEKEYEFNKALFCLNKLINLDNGNNPGDYTRIGDIYVKQDIDKALLYYENLMKTSCYEKHKIAIDYAYNDVKIKKSKGYVYKPRNKK